jgi:RNA polymerase primary sigma factor
MARRKVTRGAPPKLARSTRSRAAAPSERPTSEARKAKPSSGDTQDGPNFLGTYFREMAELEVMSAEEELKAATRIARLREDYWKALLGYPPFIEGIVGLIETRVEIDERPVAELEAILKASRGLRDRETRTNKEAYLHAMQGLAEKMGYVDQDGIVADMIQADVNTLHAGHRYGLTMDLKPPRDGSRPFLAYVERIRRASHALRAAKNAFVKANPAWWCRSLDASTTVACPSRT